MYRRRSWKPEKYHGNQQVFKEKSNRNHLDLRNSFTELKSALEKKTGENKLLMETIKMVRICNQEGKMSENSRSTEEQVVASIATSTGNEDNLTSGDMNTDSNSNKFESDSTLHAKLDEGTRENHQIQTTIIGRTDRNKVE